MNLAYRYPTIYWNAANLISNSGSEGSGSDYTKIAKSVNKTRAAGIEVTLVDINNSAFEFKPDAKNDKIYYGLKALTNVGDDLIQSIIENRPYVSMLDFINKVSPNRQAMITLIKAGAFDQFLSRKEAMVQYLWLTCDKKSRLTLQNLPGLIRNNLLPRDTEERVMAKRVYEFNRYLKDVCKTKTDNANYYLDIRAIDFLTELGQESLIEDNKLGIKVWDKQVYQPWMDIFRNWIKEDKETILDNLNTTIFMNDWKKYAENGNISSWEMKALCFYYHEHELAHVDMQRYGLVNYNQLSEEPMIDKYFNRGQAKIPIYKLVSICGTCIGKNKNKGIVYLLTTDGDVVTVKMPKEYFAKFDMQISQRNPDGTKTIMEKSFFNRGNMIIVKGIRRGDEFVLKNYKNSPGHSLYHIDKVNKDGTLEIRHDRYNGEGEDSNE